MRGALIKDGIVINIMELPENWTPESKIWQPPSDCTVSLDPEHTENFGEVLQTPVSNNPVLSKTEMLEKRLGMTISELKVLLNG